MVNSRSGRRAGDSGTRQAILIAARRAFAERGFDGATLRSIAAAAAVDPAMVSHFFGSKAGLFAAAVEPPADPDAIAAAVAEGPPGGAGERLARLLVRTLEDPATRERVIALLRTSTADESAAAMLRDLYVERIWGRVARLLGDDQADARAALLGSQVVGVAMARHVVRLEPVASMAADALVAWLAPVLQRYLTGPAPASVGASEGSDS